MGQDQEITAGQNKLPNNVWPMCYGCLHSFSLISFPSFFLCMYICIQNVNSLQDQHCDVGMCWSMICWNALVGQYIFIQSSADDMSHVYHTVAVNVLWFHRHFIQRVYFRRQHCEGKNMFSAPSIHPSIHIYMKFLYLWIHCHGYIVSCCVGRSRAISMTHVWIRCLPRASLSNNII